MIIQKYIKDQKGTVLFLTLMVLIFLSIFGGALMAMVFSRWTTVSMEYDRLRALYLAEAGISKSLWELKKGIDYDNDGLGSIPKTRLDIGYYWVTHNSNTLTITATGDVNDIKRTVKIKYAGNY